MLAVLTRQITGRSGDTRAPVYERPVGLEQEFGDIRAAWPVMPMITARRGTAGSGRLPVTESPELVRSPAHVCHGPSESGRPRDRRCCAAGARGA